MPGVWIHARGASGAGASTQQRCETENVKGLDPEAGQGLRSGGARGNAVVAWAQRISLVARTAEVKAGGRLDGGGASDTLQIISAGEGSGDVGRQQLVGRSSPVAQTTAESPSPTRRR